MRLTIGKVAKLSGVGVETLRYYERVGMVAKPQKSGSSFREYPEDAISRIRFIKRAQELGFSLKEISELLALRNSGRGSCERVSQRAEKKISEVREKIADLKRLERALEDVRKSCKERGKPTECPVLERFWNDQVRAAVL
jgi:Hg(II)-responsive transcriptional regulator